MANFIETDINQTVLMDIHYPDLLGRNTFYFYLYTLLNRPNMLDDFMSRYKNKGVGRKAYPPELLLRIESVSAISVVTS